MSILSALKTQHNSIDDLATLPQAMIMQMAQKGQIREDMLAPILARKAEMADAVARTKALQGSGQQPTVMEQILAKNAQDEAPAPRETGVAQLGVNPNMFTEQSLAGGGIVAFADGGDIEDDDEETDAYAEAFEDAEMEDLLNKSAMSGGFGRMSPRSGGIGITAGKKPNETPSVGVQPTGGDYKSYAVKMAEKYNVDPAVIVKMMGKETGGLKNPEVAVSPKGAVGVMQLMPATAKELGVKDPTDPYENIEGGVKYFAKLEKKYDDPRLAMIAYNWGPGNTDKWLAAGGDPKRLPKETQKYLLAEGGEVRHFDKGGYSGFYDEPEYGAPGSEIALGERLQNLITFGKFVPKGKVYEATKRSDEKKAAAKEVDTSGYMQGDDTYNPDLKQENVQYKTPAGAPQPPASPAATPQEDAFSRAIARFEARQKRIDETAGEDKNLALMAAGLGMMGGTSPYAFSNIGQGALKGVEQYAASKKARTAEELANEKALSGLLKAKEYADIRGANAKALEESRLRDDLLAVRKQIETTVGSRYKGDPSLWDQKTKAKVAQEIQQALASDEYYNMLAKKLGISTGNVVKPTTIDFSQIGKK